MKHLLLLVLFYYTLTFSYSQTKILMTKEQGVYTVPCKVNGLNLRFIFDTGASNVCISLSEAKFMLKNRYLEQNDIVGSSKSTIADGSIVENTRIILKEIEIGGIILYNVEAVVIHNSKAPLLFGQSAIKKLGKIELENENLIINRGQVFKLDVEHLLEESRNLYKDKLYSAAYSKYKELYTYASEYFTYKDLLAFGVSCNKSDLYYSSIEPIQKCLSDDKLDVISKVAALKELALAYEKIEKNNLSLSKCEEAIYAVNLKEKKGKPDKDLIILTRLRAEVYFVMGDNYYWGYQDARRAIDYYGKAIEDASMFRALVMGIKSQDDFVKEIVKGNVRDSFLGECFESLSFCYGKLNDLDLSLFYYEHAAKVGHPAAVDYVTKRGYSKIKK